MLDIAEDRVGVLFMIDNEVDGVGEDVCKIGGDIRREF